MEEKHRLKLKKSNHYAYFFTCRTCGMAFKYSKMVVIGLVLGVYRINANYQLVYNYPHPMPKFYRDFYEN
jgi:hypothetical protein